MLFHDSENQDAVMESTLVATPDFENQNALIAMIGQGVEVFLKAVSEFLAV